MGNLTVHFIDVGQGDSILIDYGTIEILIDGGDRSPGVIQYLQQYVDGDLEVVIATHPHADHIGGLIAVFETFKVNEIWHNGDTSTSATYRDFMSRMSAEGSLNHIAKRGDTITIGSLNLFVLNPTSLSNDTNENSIVLRMVYGTQAFLFTGDAGLTSEASMISAGLELQSDVLKVGHHGSSSATSATFLDKVKPEIAIYMAKTGNSYGHPHQVTIDRLVEVGVMIYGTDTNGTIIVTSTGTTSSIQSPNAIPIPTPTPTIPPTSPSGASGVKISNIFYDGSVPSVESDEYVEITNLGNTPVDLAGWVLKDISEGYPSFKFPSFIIQPGQKIRVYTNQIHLQYGGFSFGYGTAVWNNSSPDVAVLYNDQGTEVSRLSY
ncbi:lamin tail domain-containing protein [Dehalogenimonas sp. THU2]|uniref:lamin tail domain-containing protein n=1 Tax=Dehalogenimonas sp. THU2 TaxID=3151121 RepID=UPI00321981B4